MTKRKTLMVVLGLLPAIAVIGTLADRSEGGILQDDPYAHTDTGGTTWSGRVEYRGQMMGLWWAADVEYCVYGPGDFGQSWLGAVDPSAGEHFVYAYQIFNDLGIDPEYPYPNDPPPAEELFGPKDQQHVTTLTVGLNSLDEEAANDGYIETVAGKAPTLHNLNHTSVLWEFMGSSGADQLNYGDISDVLIFTSPRGPGWDSATLSGEIPDEQQLPSPIPESASLVLLLAGTVLGLRRRR